MNTNFLIDRILEYDVLPPDDNYSPLEFGEKIGSGVPSDAAADIVRQCWQSLPGTLSESFLEGFLDTAEVASLEEVLLGCITTTRDVG